MTTQEFSNMFDTLLNSYASQAMFGEQASKDTIVLDEYEKSVLLTQAQDLIIKQYFERTTAGEGFDDSTRRQVDFSSLIKVQIPEVAEDQSYKYDDRGVVYKLNDKVLFILNERLTVGGTSTTSFKVAPKYITVGGAELKTTESSNVTKVLFVGTDGSGANSASFSQGVLTFSLSTIGSNVNALGLNTLIASTDADITFYGKGIFDVSKLVTGEAPDQEYVTYEATAYTTTTNAKSYVIVPINYKEYDREMSKAYAQPLKKQAWRLFQNNATGYDIYSEIIPIENSVPAGASVEYKIRYVERPTPIVLTKLPEGLNIDGKSEETQCALNPILHMDILNKAVEIAYSTRGGRVAQPKEQ